MISRKPINDGRIAVLVVAASDPSVERYTLRVRLHHAKLGATVVIEQEDGTRDLYTVMGVLESRQVCDNCTSTDTPQTETQQTQ